MFGTGTLAAIAVAVSTLSGVAEPNRETAAQRLYRRGIHCQEVIERRQCAIDNFEKLLDERTTERELVTDAMLRLVTLYQKEGMHEAAKPMLRRFWNAGIKSRQTGHLPYSARFLPPELDVLVMIDVEDILSAPISHRVHADGRKWVTTCDPAKRQLLSERRQWKRAEIKAREQGKQTIEVLYEEWDRDLARRNRRAAQQEAPEAPAKKSFSPVFTEALCPLAQALGQDDISGWRRMVGALSHPEFRRSMGVVEIPDLARLLEAGRASGKLLPRGDRAFAIAGLDYYGSEVHVASLDLDELVIVPAGLMPEILGYRDKRAKALNGSLARLIDEIPRDVGFFFVMTEDAMMELGLGGMSATRRKILQALLPRPKGFQMAAVFHDYFGVFLRMPTDNPLKASLLLAFAQAALTNDDADPQEADFLRQIDVSQTEDKRALLLSYVLSPEQVRRFFFY